jgi:roadblock/LC7 domain-containing protein
MATSLDDLLRLNGVVASGEFSPVESSLRFAPMERRSRTMSRC